jgi:2-keto-4-pentenoate hydratase/2-oxohepta-3-ene-1,7-dioic acid hydratase in catechol pathway
MMKHDELITQLSVCFRLCAGDIFFDGRPGKVRVKKDLIPAIIEQKRCCTEKSNLQHIVSSVVSS